VAGIPDMQRRALQARDAIELMSDKWRIVVLHLLAVGDLRTSQLQRAMLKVSPKVLTETLRGMERDGLIGRTVHPVAPPRVEYRLTDMGRSLIPPLRNLCHWAKDHVRERDRARREFDSSKDGSE
jgi:DNA-binding HxlR family transcriptional regulator